MLVEVKSGQYLKGKGAGVAGGQLLVTRALISTLLAGQIRDPAYNQGLNAGVSIGGLEKAMTLHLDRERIFVHRLQKIVKRGVGRGRLRAALP